MSTVFFLLAAICYLIGAVMLFKPDSPGESAPHSVSFQPQAQKMPQKSEVTVKLHKLDWIAVGERIRVRHPVQGELTLHVLGRAVYAELWQRGRGPQVPWTPTGNAFAGFWLEMKFFLLNWQERYYLLEERVPLTDADIAKYFAPFARQFAQSDQKADIHFAYPPVTWHIDDIGKFRVETLSGEGLRTRPAAVGRFIHASGENQRALVVEDYEGGGEDAAWIGYQIAAEDIAKS